MRELIETFLAYLGLPLAYILIYCIPLWNINDWFFNKKQNAFELIERAMVLSVVSGFITLLGLIGILAYFFSPNFL